jgi:hypothetical protein
MGAPGHCSIVQEGTAMTEAEWSSSDNPMAMLEDLRLACQVSARKLRLFGVACSRRVWGRLDESARAAVEIAERFADGLASADELRTARLWCKSAGDSASWYAAATRPDIAARNAALSAQAGAPIPAERAVQAALLRDLFGNRYRPLSSMDQAWLAPGGTAARLLAQAIYDEKDFSPGRMALLADVLAGAGCTNSDVLGHSRGSGPHVRGCWVVDWILGKE